MAACRPDPRAAFIRNTEENNGGQALVDLLTQLDSKRARKGFKQEIQDFDRQFAKETFGMSVEELNTVLAQRMGKELTPETVMSNAMLVRGAKGYYYANLQGLSEIADKVVKAAAASEDPLSHGLPMLGQLDHLAELSDNIMGWDRAFGRSLLAQNLKESRSFRKAMSRAGVGGADADEVAKEMAKPVTERIKEQINSGNPKEIEKAKRAIVELGTQIKAMRDPFDAKKLTNLNRVGNLLWTIMYNGMLSGPRTMVVNATALGYAFFRPAAQLLASAPFAVLGDGGARQAMVESMAMIASFNQSYRDAFRVGFSTLIQAGDLPLYGRNADTAANLGRPLYGGFNAADIGELTAKMGIVLEPGSTQWDMLNNVGYAVNLPAKVISGTDDISKHFALRYETRRRGIQRALSNGVDLGDADAMRKAMEAEENMAFNFADPDPTNKWQVNKAYEYADSIMDEARYVTFQQDNGIADFMETALEKAPWARPFFPFVRTPTNIIIQSTWHNTGLAAAKGTVQEFFGNMPGAKNNPLLAMMQTYKDIMLKKDQDPGMFYRTMGQIGISYAMVGTIYQLAMQGHVEGGGPALHLAAKDEWNQQRAWENSLRAKNMTAYSIRIGDYVVPWKQLGEPFSLMLRMTADVAAYSGYISQQEQEWALTTVMGVGARGMFNASFLAGAYGLMEAISDDDDTGRKKARLSRDYLSAFTPFGSLLNFIKTSAIPRGTPGSDPFRDDLRRDGWSDVWSDDLYWGPPGEIAQAWIQGPLARIVSKVPGLGNANPPLIDEVEGLPVPVYPGNGPYGVGGFQAAIPFYPREVQSDGTWENLFKARGNYQEYMPNHVKLNGWERAQLKSLMGNITIGDKTYRQTLDALFATDAAQEEMSRNVAQVIRGRTPVMKQIDKIKKTYGDAAFAELMRQNPILARRFALGMLSNQAGQAGDLSLQNQIDAEIRGLEEGEENTGQYSRRNLMEGLPAVLVP